MHGFRSSSFDLRKQSFEKLRVMPNPHLNIPLRFFTGPLKSVGPIKSSIRHASVSTQSGSLSQNAGEAPGLKTAISQIKEVYNKQQERLVLLSSHLEQSRNQFNEKLDSLSVLLKKKQREKSAGNFESFLDNMDELSFLNDVPPVESQRRRAPKVLRPKRKFKSLFDAVSGDIDSLTLKP